MDDWTPSNPRWWAEQSPTVATYAAKDYYLTIFSGWFLILLAVLSPVIAVMFIINWWA